ncbi:hypothetical protein HDU98_003829 [Podochytrium sp. JEL0797]|nr:hypothetical protein HDU98_003829 [Podochytrium sp. JEL0797]
MDLEERLADALEQMAAKERDLIMAAEFGQQLLEANERLQNKLESIEANQDSLGDKDALKKKLRETEKQADRQIQSLTRQTQSLTTDLRAALQDHRKSELDHAKQVRLLEDDLEELRSELVARANAATAAAVVGGKAVKKDSHSDDADLEDRQLEAEMKVKELEAELESLTVWKKEAETTIKQTTSALQDSLLRLHAQDDRLQAAAAMRQEFETRGTLIVQLKEQVEDLHLRLQTLEAGDDVTIEMDPATARSLAYNKDWEWTPWLESVKTKAWDRNLSGLKEEVEELRLHRIEAYNRLKEQMDQTIVSFVDRLPDSVKQGVGKVAAVVGVPLSGVDTLPASLTDSQKESTNPLLNIDTVIAMFPNVPRVEIEKDLAKTRSARLTIENILNGQVALSQKDVEGSGLSWTVANPEE